MSKKVLIIEDEVKISRMISDYYIHHGFRTCIAQDGLEGIERFNQQEIDLVILDVMLPKLDGFTVLRKIRKISNVPVIMLTARLDEDDMLLGYELKVDDYMTKPFHIDVLIAKSKVLLERIGQLTKDEAVQSLCLNGIKVDEQKMEVYLDDELIELERKQFEVLHYLMEHKNMVISREQLLEAKWGYDYYGNTRVVDSQIKKLRKNLKHKAYCIKTIFGVGYKFEVEK